MYDLYLSSQATVTISKGNKMKNNIEKFSNRSGIVKMEHEGEELFVVYGHIDNFRLENRELGEAIAKGETYEEAMKNAVKNLIERISKLDKKNYELNRKIEFLIHDFNKDKDNDVIIGVRGIKQVWNEVIDECEYVESDEVYNATIGFDEDGKPEAWCR